MLQHFVSFSGAGGSKIDEKRDRERLGAPTLLRERLRITLGLILESFCEHFGFQKLISKQAEN